MLTIIKQALPADARRLAHKCVEWHAKKRRDLGKLRFRVIMMTSGPEKGALDVRAALLTEGYAVAQVYCPQALMRYLAGAIKDSTRGHG